ncbi:DNA-directed RNA polymerase subunit beta [Nocardia abscessus]|uniref:DNA-directed RNA polymerase subunit beta n=2 Tax=Nocardiaceae TaxID=85025 RepID=UPI001895C5E5|nr:DNA-directed RNA polymerase subunit beta [Nocardia abscessus]MBF6219000.1 DNA-directed RNA polymerase subunit beta [Nocardia abscessus]
MSRGLLMDEGAFGDTPLSRCQYYRRTCDLPVVIDPPELGRIILRAGSVWGVTMPPRLGQAVKAYLQSRGNGGGPIVGHPRSGRWTFLIRPDIELGDVKLFAEMFRLDVNVARTGASIALPSPTASAGAIRHWIVPPRNPFRPSGQVVVAAVRAWADQVHGGRRPRASMPDDYSTGGDQ